MVRGQFAEQMESVKYDYSVVSGEELLEVSGECKLKSVVIGRKTSGQIVKIYDAAISGRWLSAGAKVVSLIYGGDALNTPVEVNYDIELKSGLVVVTSGATWNLTIMRKQ